MSIPITYNLRNLVVRKTTSIMTAVGIALTVAVLLTILALINGLHDMLSASGDPLQVITLRKGSDSEVMSNFTRSMFQDLKFKTGIARARNGDPLASLEVVTAITLPRAGSTEEINVTVRGLLPVGTRLVLRSILPVADGSSRAGANWLWESLSARALPTRKSKKRSLSVTAIGTWWV